MNPEEKDPGGPEKEPAGPGRAGGESAFTEPEAARAADCCEVPEDGDGVFTDDGGSLPGPAPEEEAERAAEGGAQGPLEAPGPGGEGSRLKSILEALIFVSEQPISLDRMAGVLSDCSRARLKQVLDELEQDYEIRAGALEIVKVANGYQFRTRAEFAPWIGRLRQQKFTRLSRAALETLAIVAYRQPVTRAEAEAIRGVDSGAVLGTLLERRLLRILGRKDVAGRPILYGTTQEFLELFGLNSLKDLPTLKEIKDIVEQAEREAGEEGAREAETGREAAGAPAGAAADEDGQRLDGEDSAPRSEKREQEEGGEEGDFEDGSDWSEDEEPLPEEDFTPSKLDEILKSTRTRLELYQPDVEEEEEGGQAETAGGGEVGEDDEDMTEEEDGPDDD